MLFESPVSIPDQAEAFVLSPFLRLFKIDEGTGARWVLRDQSQRTEWLLVPTFVRVLAFCSQPRPYHDIHEFFSIDVPELGLLGLSFLINQGILVRLSESSHPEVNECIQAWRERGWTEAAEHYLSTYNVPFLPGNNVGYGFAGERMRLYAEEEPDSARYKDPAYLRAKDLPRLETIRLRSPSEFEKLDLASQIEEVLGLAVPFTRSVKVAWGGQPLYFRTVPSGGGRQPVEVYLVTLDEDASLWHVNAKSAQLGLLDEIDTGTISRVFRNILGRSPFRVSYVVIVTTVFARNMYRYREPRTFRSVHMDAGHMAANIELLSEKAGLRHFVEYPANELEVDSLLGLDPLRETVQVCISLGKK